MGCKNNYSLFYHPLLYSPPQQVAGEKIKKIQKRRERNKASKNPCKLLCFVRAEIEPQNSYKTKPPLFYQKGFLNGFHYLVYYK